MEEFVGDLGNVVGCINIKTEFRVCRKTVHTFLYTTVYDLLN